MADHVRKQIRAAAVAALTGLATSGARVYASRVYAMQDTDLPGLRVYTNEEAIDFGSMGPGRVVQRVLDLVVEACAKANSALDDTLDAMVKEVEVALAANQGAGGAKYVQLKSIEIEMDGEAEKPIGLARMTFQVLYYTALGTPDVAQ